MKLKFLSAAALPLLIGVASPVQAAVCVGTYQQCLDLGVNNNYGIVGLGGSITMNSGPVTGNVLIGRGESTTSSGGGNGQIVGTVFTDGTATGDFFSHLQVPEPAPTAISAAVTLSAMQSANSVSDYAATLAATQVFSALIAGNGGLNVINAVNLHNQAFTLAGNANDYFVFNITGLFDTNLAMTLSGAVDPNHILFNLLGTGTVFQTSGGNTLYGNFLAVNGGSYQFSNLHLTGRLINTDGFDVAGAPTTGGHMQFVSGSYLTAPPPPVPEPGTWALMLLGFGAIGLSMRFRQKVLQTA